MSWKKLSSKEIYRNRFMWMTEDEVETDAGKKMTYGVIHKKPFALIIPWDGEKFTLIGEYRYFVDFFSWGFPQGHYEHDSIEQTAIQELREETGQTAESIRKIGSFWIGPGAIDQECFVFLATDLTEGNTDREESEDGPTITALGILESSDLI